MEQSPRHLIPSMATLGMGAVAPTQMPPSEPPLTQSDLGAAMSGLSFMARKTEENMANLFRQQSTKMEEHMNSYFSGLEMQMCSLKHTLAAQYQLIQENQIIMKEQQGIIEYQTAQIEKLANDNDELKEKMRSLQEDISIFRLQGPCNNANKDEIKKTVEEKRMGAGGCGSMLYATEVDMMNGINEMISFHMSPLITAQDSTIPLKDIRNNKDDEDYTHTSNIEVTLVEDDPVTVNEQVEGEDNSADDHDNYSGDDNNNNRDDCEEVSRKH
ncbi:unnamed protein product [Pseudo-nitzschia multistriata]|uniref:Uncharacterized protein n=1 Tax=Pseudo-nitzschia multistriata TaxID=183589 RepID=A0A448Z5E3_9STRA|nr:unnamed protein product [Pseudo-nitzschia multistriata]